jgi:hypothetical protein
MVKFIISIFFRSFCLRPVYAEAATLRQAQKKPKRSSQIPPVGGFRATALTFPNFNSISYMVSESYCQSLLV